MTSQGEINAPAKAGLMGLRLDAPLMVAEVCMAYGWTVDHVLNMPARRFFSMTDCARVLKAWDKIDLADISAVAACTPEYQSKLKEAFAQPINRRAAQTDLPLEDKKALKGEVAHNQLLQIFGGEGMNGGQ